MISSSNENPKSDDLMILIDKPLDYSSAMVVNIIKKKLNIKKAGHSGTLDPKATGLMIVCTGKKTKNLSEFLGFDKEYEVLMVIGRKTKSFDSETDVYEINDISEISFEMVIDTINSFKGEIKQIPPMFSAVKYKGKPLYKYARKNKEIERQPKTINISELEILKTDLPEVLFRVRCSKGTYIRSLVNDIGEKLGVGAYLLGLKRTMIGNYNIKDSLSLDEFLNHSKS